MLANEPMLMLALSVVALYYGRPVLMPLAMALTLNFLLAPVVILLQKVRVGRLPAVVLVMVFATTVVGGVGWIVARQLLNVASDLPNYRLNIHDKMDALHMPKDGALGRALTSMGEVGQEISGTQTVDSHPIQRSHMTRKAREEAKAEAEAHPKPSLVTVVPPPITEREYLRQFVTPVLRPLGTATMVIIFTFYMLLKREDLRNRLLLLAGAGRLNVMTQALNDAAQRISSFLVMNAVVNAAYGVVFGVGLYLLHVPNATLWGALAGLLRLVPYAGTLVGGSLPFLYSLAVFDTWGPPLFVLLLFGVLEITVANFVEPWLYGSHTGISSLALLITAVVWTLLWGIPGLVLATPLTVCLIVLGRYVPQMSFLHVLLGDEAELTPDAHFYERLLAMDQAEAHAIADRYLEGRTSLELYDAVLLPALCLVEQDRHKGVLDEVRSAFMLQSITELTAELMAFDTGLERKGCPIVCIPANEQTDQVAAAMLAQVLEQSGHNTMMLPVVSLSDEILARLAAEPETSICISALPPFAFARARALCQRLREQLPQNKIVLGLWGSNANLDSMRERFGTARPDAVVKTLAQASNELKQCERVAV
ncbi:putative PurR-regulated permease PerM [Acidipila rosea]|uniref:Putative PurR-regulated permease PerM n=2 Tax=Acidipila rosea TaxID=768535 RepID=A0A4R1L4I8_9BACT|nr:putative PurR-regulated permease PerM [Acidipila rosea]